MNTVQDSRPKLVPLDEAQRICREKLGMSEARFRHELAEHVRGNGGIPWAATEASVGVLRGAMEDLLRRAELPPEEERSDDR